VEARDLEIPGAAGLAASAKQQRWSREQAAALLAAWQKSGLTLARFAKERGLVPERLRWWRDKLMPAEAATPAAPAGSAVRFVPVRVARKGDTRSAPSLPQPRSAPPERAIDNQAALEVMLANGRRVRVAPDFDAASLTRLIATLEALPC
jgi:transposase-like protein